MNETLAREPDASPELVEQILIDAAARGDVEAFAELYDAHVQRVYRYFCYWIGDTEEREDLTQQVFLQAWRAIGRYKRTRAPFRAWLVTIAHNLVVDYYRSKKPTATLDRDPPAQDRWSNPEAHLLAASDQESVRRAILRLKPEHQRVLTLRFVEQCEYAEIAQTMGKTEGNIRVIQHRALAELRRLVHHQVHPR